MVAHFREACKTFRPSAVPVVSNGDVPGVPLSIRIRGRGRLSNDDGDNGDAMQLRPWRSSVDPCRHIHA